MSLILYLNILLSISLSLSHSSSCHKELLTRKLNVTGEVFSVCKSKTNSVGSTVIFTSWDLLPLFSLVNQGEKGLTPFFPMQVRHKWDSFCHAKIFPPHPCDVKHKAAHFSCFLDRGNNFLICPEGARAKMGRKRKSLWNWLEERCILFKLEVKIYSKGEIISIFIKCQRVWLLDLPQATLGLKTFQQDLIDPDGLRLFLFFTPSTLLPPA